MNKNYLKITQPKDRHTGTMWVTEYAYNENREEYVMVDQSQVQIPEDIYYEIEDRCKYNPRVSLAGVQITGGLQERLITALVLSNIISLHKAARHKQEAKR